MCVNRKRSGRSIVNIEIVQHTAVDSKYTFSEFIIYTYREHEHETSSTRETRKIITTKL